MDLLKAIGYKLFNFTLGEEPQFVLPFWVDAEILIRELEKYGQEIPKFWGEVYASYGEQK